MISSECRQERHNFVSVRIHLVCRVRRGFPLIKEELQDRTWAYIGGIVRRLDLTLYQVGGQRDHAHIFFGLAGSIALSSVVQRIKSNSSAWLRQQPGMARFEWQQGYGAFSVSVSHTDRTMAYIRGQREHHARRDFDAELREIMRRHGVALKGSRTGQKSESARD
jgi:REP element-mobilizing transposase RayT